MERACGGAVECQRAAEQSMRAAGQAVWRRVPVAPAAGAGAASAEVVVVVSVVVVDPAVVVVVVVVVGIAIRGSQR